MAQDRSESQGLSQYAKKPDGESGEGGIGLSRMMVKEFGICREHAHLIGWQRQKLFGAARLEHVCAEYGCARALLVRGAMAFKVGFAMSFTNELLWRSVASPSTQSNAGEWTIGAWFFVLAVSFNGIFIRYQTTG